MRSRQSVPESFKLVYSEKAISEAVNSIAALVTKWASETLENDGLPILSVPVLRGGIFFFADLTREIAVPVEIDTVRASAYLNKGGGRREVVVDLQKLKPEGRRILLVDEICDTGRTLAALVEQLKAKGAKEVRTACLVHRIVPDSCHKPDYLGFNYEGGEWLAGYGMKGGEYYGNLRAVYAVQNTVADKG